MSGRAGASGRIPEPTALKLLKGNPGKRPINEREPKPKVKLPPCPATLNPVARKEWYATGRKLLLLGVVTEIDRTVLAAYCTTYARWTEAEAMLMKGGILWKGTHKTGEEYYYQSLYLQVANTALTQMMRLLTELGLTPASRSRISTTAPPGGANNPNEEFFTG